MALRLNWVKWGIGTPTVLMLHGLGDGAFIWNHIAPSLAVRATVSALELRGHGDSPRDPDARYEPEAYVRDVLETIKLHVGARPITLVGHSLGAAVAIHVAAVVRDQVRGLALVDGGPGLNPAALRHIYEQFRSQQWFHANVESFSEELQRRHPIADPRLIRRVAEHALRELPSGGYELKFDKQVVAADRKPNDELLWEKLQAFDGPKLIVRGAGSAVLTRAGATRMERELPNCRLHTVPMAGHTVMLDNPDELLLAIEKFLSGIH
jgi:pimeloyl-ACP methyl ester carboxylesterase